MSDTPIDPRCDTLGWAPGRDEDDDRAADDRSARLTCAECSSLGLDTATGTGDPPMRGTCSVCGGPWPRDYRAVHVEPVLVADATSAPLPPERRDEPPVIVVPPERPYGARRMLAEALLALPGFMGIGLDEWEIRPRRAERREEMSEEAAGAAIARAKTKRERKRAKRIDSAGNGGRQR